VKTKQNTQIDINEVDKPATIYVSIRDENRHLVIDGPLYLFARFVHLDKDLEQKLKEQLDDQPRTTQI